jgi:hypothetical protein
MILTSRATLAQPAALEGAGHGLPVLEVYVRDVRAEGLERGSC